ncbi:hypothetical protein FOL47_007414 [Perkinsus chesapeaki]|uniref:Peptidase A1 domain-containing protein n=1 Tax=Perkinsus chesapeaki TaxID=330153 RepID=A0A7J6LKL1_PERCH|nr:hypothetical protein FOL47_007414 [Perkinsus chesapeaki]
MALTKLVSMAGLWSVGGSSISLPFEDGKVSIGLDGQSTKVRIDSGSARFFVLYGPEFGEDRPFFGIAGLSHGRVGIPETFLEQLLRLNVISNPSYLIHTDGDARKFNGEIVLGGLDKLDKSFVRIKGINSKVAVYLWPMRLATADGRELPPLLPNERASKPCAAFVDSGATNIDLKDSELERFIKGSSGIVWFNNEQKKYVVDETNQHRLPTLLFYIGGKTGQTEIRIEPRHYVQRCLKGLCVLKLFRISDEDLHSLGHPVFHAYDVGVDLSGEESYIFIRNNKEAATVGGLGPTTRILQLRELLKNKNRGSFSASRRGAVKTKLL